MNPLETGTETLHEAIRNHVVNVSQMLSASRLHNAGAHRTTICTSCMRRGHDLNSVLSAINELEARGEIMSTETGAYVLGNPSLTPSAPGELILTSTDPMFGQPSLF